MRAAPKTARKHPRRSTPRRGKIQNRDAPYQNRAFFSSLLKAALFVDGCFWHGCPRHFIQPKGNAAFWRKKIATNRARDRKVNRTLRTLGWKVIRVWEHELAKRNAPRLLKRLNSLRLCGSA